MNKQRKDAWSKDEDMLLAETVLRYIRNGKTQLEAFEEASKALSRTASACGFRWNTQLRKQYADAIQLARRREQHVPSNNESVKHEMEAFTIDTAISLLENLKKEQAQSGNHHVQAKQVEQFQNEINLLNEQLNAYKKIFSEIFHILNEFQEQNNGIEK